MRRGLITWSRDEVPASVLDSRVARLQERMRAADLAAALIYTSFARPSAVAWLTQFVPYWNEALLVVPQSGAPVLLAAFSKRMEGWVRSVSHVGEVLPVAQLGRAAAKFVEERVPRASTVAALELDALPWPVAEPLSAALGTRLVDASALFASIRQPADDTEITMTQRAAQIAAKALGSIPAAPEHASQLLAAVERSARLDGAEEVLPRLAPDLAAGTALLRVEGDMPLGERHAVELSVAYKGAWARVARCFARSEPPGWSQARQWTADWATRVTALPAAPPSGTIAFWSLEACIGSEPWSVVASAIGPRGPVAAGTLASFSIQLQLADGPWLGAGTVVIGRDRPGRLLA
jgi:Xaa-Pro aminopeptidase